MTGVKAAVSILILAGLAGRFTDRGGHRFGVLIHCG